MSFKWYRMAPPPRFRRRRVQALRQFWRGKGEACRPISPLNLIVAGRRGLVLAVNGIAAKDEAAPIIS
jgi:hypothetical protein